MAAEFKIGRLRYNWAGTWTPATEYSRDDIVINDGKAYTCLVPNTASANFYTDLYNTFPRWQLVIDGKTWVGPWANNYSYGVGHIVIFGGKAYYSIVAHTSTSFASDIANWAVYTEFDAWKPNWTTNTVYGINDVVKYGGIVYKCITNHTSAGSSTLGLESNQSAWEVYYSGVEYKGPWATGIRYKLNDLVKVNANIYICTQFHTASSTLSTSNFTLWLPGQMSDLIWSSSTTYQIGDSIIYGGDAYISKVANNVNKFPDTEVDSWGLFNVGYTVRNNWSSATAYAPGDLVSRNGVLYEATARSTAQDPNTSTVTKNYIASGSSGTTINLLSSNGVIPGMTVSGSGITSGQRVSTVTTSTASASGKIAGTPITISSFTSSTATGPYLVTFTIPTQSLPPSTGISYTVSGNSNSSYNGSFTATASSITSITLSYPTNPGSYGTGTTTIASVVTTYTVSAFLSNAPSAYLLEFAIPTQGSAPVTNAQYTVSGNSNTLFNGTFNCTASTTTSITLSYAVNPIGPGSYGTGTTLVTPTSGTVLTLSGAVTGTFSVGMVLNGAGISNNYIVSGSGTSWVVNTAQAATITTVTGTLTSVVLSSVPNGTLTDGQSLSFLGLNSNYWSLLIPGKQWANRWSVGSQYRVGDIVLWATGTYVCVNANIASYISPVATNRPDYDTTSTYWILLIAHDLNNSLNVTGDLRTFKNNRPSAVDIGVDTYVLGVSSDIPNWRKLNVVPAVYYVSTYIGQDTDAYGITWDQPWKTIKYACDKINQGFYYPNSVTLLKNNKAFMVAELYQWMIYQMSQNISPFSPESLWDPTHAQRDAERIIDAIIYDLKRGGNSQIVAATLSYFYFGSKTQLVNSVVASTIIYYSPSLTYLLSLMQSIITNTSVSTNYQLLNNVTPSSVVNQIIDNTLIAESGTATEISSLMSIVITALTNQNAHNVPSTNTGISASIYVKTGTYDEFLPIVVPENVSIIGDELRSAVVQPATSKIFYCTQTIEANANPITSNTMVVNSTVGLTDQMPIQFISPYVNNASTTFGNVVSGQTYYIKGSSITSTSLQINDGPTFSFKGSTTNNSNIISNVSSITQLQIGMAISGPGILANTYVYSFAQEINSVSNITLCIGYPLAQNYVFVASNATTSGILQTFTASGNLVNFTNGSGNMLVNAGECLKNMFLMRNGTTIRNLSFFGLKGTLTANNQYSTARPTGGAYTSLDPGTGPNDTSAWIIRRSPYVQNVTVFGDGATGIKIDGYLHNGGSKSIVSNDYTMVISDGVGIWCTGPGAITEAISVFSYYCYAGYFAEAGGRIRSANGNSSYGTFGIISEGYDLSESPLTGTVNNQSQQVQAGVISAFGTSDQLLKLNYSNAGSAYYEPTTNMLKYSNDFLSVWTNDANLAFIKNNTAPSGYTEAWLLTGSTGTPGQGYIQQSISINPAGSNYTNISGTTQDGAPGNSATFNITVTPTSYVVTVNTPGTLYQTGNNILIKGSVLGGLDDVNDLTIVVGNLSGTGISTISASSGIVPAGSSQSYTLSMYVYAGNSASVDIQAVFSGTTTVTSGINYNVSSHTVTPYSGTSITSSANGGTLPTSYGAQQTLVTGWYRVWMSINDSTGVNNTLTYKFFPQGANAPIANTYSIIYGSQLGVSRTNPVPAFYLETTTNRFTAYANYQIVGAGANAILSGDESRSQSVFNARIVTDNNGFTGGAGYATSINTAQEGDTYSIRLAATDQGIFNYLGMRVFISSGTGAGQYGFVSYYNNSSGVDANGISSKTALVLKESIDPVSVIASTYSATAALNLLTLSPGTDISTWYVNQAVQFIPTFYTTTATATSIDTVVATATVGGVINTMAIPTASLLLNMPVTFNSGDFNITEGFLYYIVTIDYELDLIQLSTAISGNPIQLSTVASGSQTMTFPRYSGYIKAPTANMVPNINIQFTGVALGGLSLGTNYFINDIIDGNNFTVSTNRVTLTSVETIGGVTNTVRATTTSLVPLNPIVFSGTIFDSAIQPGTTYYISNIVDANNFNIATNIIRVTATETEFSTNLIKVSDTTGFVVNNPIIFSGIAPGTTFGNIASETVYYIQTINPSTNQITITLDKTNTFILTDKAGLIQVRTCPEALTLGGGTGSMTLTSTGTRLVVTNSVGNISTMNGTFSTSLFGGINSYTRYFITALTPPGQGNSNTTVSISTTQAGTPITLTTGVGNMQMAASGWDNINPGTVDALALDSTSSYVIEPKTTFSLPTYQQASGSVSSSLSNGASFTSVAYGDNYFVAIPTSGIKGARSSNGTTWTPVALPSTVNTWADIAFGNSYWAALGTTTSGSNSIVAYSNSNGLGWRTSALPINSTWNKIVYGNGTFVAISSDNTCAAYSTNQGLTWTASSLPSSTAVSRTGTPVINTTQQKFGVSSLYLNGSSHIDIATDSKFAYNSEDFTVECFVRPTSLTGTQVVVDQRTAANEASIAIDISAAGAVRLYVLGSYRITSTTLITAGAWHHIAVSRASGVTRLFVNGTVQGTTYTDTNIYLARPIAVGASFSASNRFTGHIDEIRVSRGVSRYTTTFTPTSSAFTADSNTMLLMHLDNTDNSTAITSSIGSWVSLTYGSGLFVAINNNGQTAWSSDGVTWNLSTLPTNNTILSGVTIIGSAGQFTCTTTTNQLVVGQSIVVSGQLTSAGGEGTITNGTYYISATNGKTSFTLATTFISAIQGTNPITTGAGTTTGLTFAVGAPAYTSIAFGNNKFVAIQSGRGLRSAISFDGVNWLQSANYVSATKISYGQGVFVVVNSNGTDAAVSEHGIYWKSRTLTYGSITAMTFGFSASNIGLFATLTGDGSSTGNATAISEGARAQGRANINSGIISAVSLWETGSNYTSTPSVAFSDYNVSVTATVTPRVGNGSLSNPTFINRGSGYNTTSTVVTITGNGYADTFQTGLNLIVKNLASVPLIGSNVSIAGNNQIYKVTSASAVYGTTAPFIEATIQLSPEMTTTNSPAHNTAVELRQLYSQCRVTNHDFLLVGTGNRATANYPYVDITTARIQNQAVETNQGHVFYTSTDENGNFSVGGLFGVQQATGTVTLSATQFGLTGLETLSLGGIAVGSSSVVINQFSTDNTFAANSDAIVPTQRAVKSFLTGRLSQGGANTFTGNFIAGTVNVGGPNFIKSTVANGAVGSAVKMANKVYITSKGVDGNMAALGMFMRKR